VKKFNLYVLPLGLWVGLALPVQAEHITRHCHASYEITDHNGRGTFRTDDFMAAGICGDSVANRCRRRARDAVIICMKNHWAVRNHLIFPPTCYRRINGDKYVTGTYNAGNRFGQRTLATYLKQHICMHWNIYGSSTVVKITGGTTDTDHCSQGVHRVTLAENYHVDCSTFP